MKILTDHPNLDIVYHWNSEESVPREDLLDALRQNPDVEGIYCLLTDPIDPELLELAPNLKCVSTMSVGFNHIDVPACRDHDPSIRIGYTPEVLTDATAELAVSLLCTVARRLPESAVCVRDGSWGTWKPEWMCGMQICGSTVGVVGMGRIGQKFASIMHDGFGCRIVYYSRSRKVQFEEEVLRGSDRVTFVDSLDRVLEEADIVVPHVSLNDETHEMFNAAAFEKMKETAIFVNTTRGEVVDQKALYEALSSGRIAGAGLDVTTPEPLPTDHELLSLPNCFIVPHIGSATTQTRDQMAIVAAQNLIGGLLDGEDMVYELE